MEQLEMVKAFTELEINSNVKGVKSIEFDDTQNCFWVEVIGFSSFPVLDCIDNLSLNCEARDKYRVEVSYDYGIVTRCLDDGVMSDPVSSAGNQIIGHAVIECILKSKGLWK